MSIGLIALSLLGAPAHADLSPGFVSQKKVEHILRVDNLAAHPGMAVLVVEEGSSTLGHVAFTPDGPRFQRLHHGGPARIGLKQATVKVLPLRALEAWEEAVSTYGGGYPHPEEAVDCGVSIEVRRTGVETGADRYISVVRIDEASKEACAARDFGVERRRANGEIIGRVLPLDIGGEVAEWEPAEVVLPGEDPAPAPEAEEPVAPGAEAPVEPTAVEESSSCGGCASVTSVGSVGAGLLMVAGLAGLRRREGALREVCLSRRGAGPGPGHAP